ncbi:MAG: UvrD-helicase domain-containing protein, partial [Clostridia bacterium]|nr:UvrD-helicase domain-containing protein [Clostridia bacterium]
MIDVNNLINKLNSEQVKPVLDTEGAVLVIAGAGSGKTRVLTTRIAYLVSEKKVPADRILAITFTNKAAGEMKERLTKILGDIPQMWVCTIHSMCVRILRRDIDVLGYDKNFTIYDETDRDRLIKKVLDDLGYDSDKIFKPSKTYISIAKNECLSPDEFLNEYSSLKFAEEIHNVYKLYQNYLERSNSLDFDDLLFLTNKLFVEYPDVAEYYANKFEYVHIDEFQDTNSVQFNICRVLTKKHGNIFAVGDDDQSIYGWRGARIENILSFDDVYRGAKVYKLEQNYRSTKKILKLANTIISNNKGRRVKELWTDNDEGCKVETFVAGDENNEASYVAMQIKSLYSRSETLRYKDFAVFMRVNALSRAVEQEFLKYGIPYKVYGGFRFFERKEIKDVLAYLKVINNHYDNESFIRAVSSPKRGIGDKTLQELREYAVSIDLSMFDAIDFIDNTTIGASAQKRLRIFKDLLVKFKEYSQNNSIVELINFVIKETGFLEQFDDSDEDESKVQNVSELVNSAELFVRDNVEVSLSDYLNSITLSSDTDEINSDDSVTVATIHAAKGLEYKCVFVIGLDE